MESAATTVILHLEKHGLEGKSEVRDDAVTALAYAVLNSHTNNTIPAQQPRPIPKNKLKHFPFPSATPHESL